MKPMAYPGFYWVVARYGYLDQPNHSAAFARQVLKTIAHYLEHGSSCADLQALDPEGQDPTWSLSEAASRRLSNARLSIAENERNTTERNGTERNGPEQDGTEPDGTERNRTPGPTLTGSTAASGKLEASPSIPEASSGKQDSTPPLDKAASQHLAAAPIDENGVFVDERDLSAEELRVEISDYARQVKLLKDAQRQRILYLKTRSVVRAAKGSSVLRKFVSALSLVL